MGPPRAKHVPLPLAGEVAYHNRKAQKRGQNGTIARGYCYCFFAFLPEILLYLSLNFKHTNKNPNFVSLLMRGVEQDVGEEETNFWSTTYNQKIVYSDAMRL